MSKSKKEKREYDLKQSAAEIGYLYPVLKTSEGEIIAGKSRLEADPNWPIEIREELDTPLKVNIARLTENLHRRSLPAGEKRKTLSTIAEALLEEGFEGDLVKEIAKKLATTEAWVRKYLDDKFKQMEFLREPTEIDAEIKAAIQRGDSVRTIIKALKCGQGRIYRIKHELEAVPIVDVAQAIPREIAIAEIPTEAAAEDTIEEKSHNQLEGLTKEEVVTMRSFRGCLEKFKRNYSEIPTVTPLGQSIHGWVERFLEMEILDSYID